MIYNYMQMAIEEAKKSNGDIPVGAVLVQGENILAKAYNTKEKDNDITSHAEIIAIRQGETKVGNWRLDGCELYVTLEPCPMCAWAIFQSRISKVYFGAYDLNYGALLSKVDLISISNNKPQIIGGILEEKCNILLNDFFEKMRK